MDRTIISLLFGFLATLLGIYSLLVIVRIILTWFSSLGGSRLVQILSRITDPYLDWWKTKFNLRVGILDISPIIALAVLSVLQTLCSSIAAHGKISLSIIIVVSLLALRSAVSFILGFCLLILVLRFIAFKASVNIYNPFWQTVDTISRPLLYRVNRIIFGKRIVKYSTGIIAAIIAIALLWVGIHLAIGALCSLSYRLSL